MGRRVIVEPLPDTEAGQQRCAEQSAAGGGPDQGEAREAQADTAGVGPLVDDDVELEVLHGRIEVLLDGLLEAVDLVDEEHIPFGKIGQQTRQIGGLLDGGTAGRPHRPAHGPGQDVRQGRLAQSRRPAEEDVIERFLAPQGRLHGDLQALLHLGLPGEVREGGRPQGHLEGGIRLVQRIQRALGHAPPVCESGPGRRGVLRAASNPDPWRAAGVDGIPRYRDSDEHPTGGRRRTSASGIVRNAAPWQEDPSRILRLP